MNKYTRVSRRAAVVTGSLPVLLSLLLFPLAAVSASPAAPAAPATAASSTPASTRPTIPVSNEIEQRLPKIKQRLLSALPPGALIEKIVQPADAESITAIPAGSPAKLTVAGTLGPGQNVIQAVATLTSRNRDIGDADVVKTSMDPDNRTYFEFLLTITPAQ
ncbi:MAG: hypothetical protein ABI411_05475 [Tahibacter sp.]